MSAVEKKQRTPAQIAGHVSIVSIIVNLVLAALKLIAGLLARSGALVSDAVHSTSDIFSTVVVMIGIKMSSKASDRDHQYGHERMECIAAFVLAAVLFATGLLIGCGGVRDILNHNVPDLNGMTAAAVAAAAVSIAVKELMYRYTAAAAKKINSAALMADAWHHRSDALSSVGSLIGVAGILAGVPVIDPVAAVVICLFILKAAYDIARDAADKLVDKSCDEAAVSAIKSAAMSVNGVVMVKDIKTRLFGSRIYADLIITCDGDLTLWEADAIAERVHDAIENSLPDVKHCTVHADPAKINHEI